MAKKESTITNMLLTLFVVTLVASTALGYIYELTKEPIAAAKLAKKTNAIRQVVPDFDNSPFEDAYAIFMAGDSIRLYPAKMNGELVGTAIETFSNSGFSGNIKIMVGMLPDGLINNIAVLEHKETPGLGDKMEKKKSSWSNQFNGKNPESWSLKVTKDGGKVDAITAATISSRAYCEAVQNAHEAYKRGGKK